MAAKGVTADELKKAKDHAEGVMKLALEDSSAKAEFFARQELFFGNVKTLEQKIAELRAVTVADIARVAKEILVMSRLSIGVVGPFKTDAAVLQHIKI